MACIGEKQRARIVQDIHLYFQGLADPSDFKIKDYLSNIYQLGSSQGVKEETALNFMQVIPEILNIYLATKGIEISEEEEILLTKLKRQFKKNDLEYIYKNIIASKTPVTIEEKQEEEEPEELDENGRKISLFNPYTNVILSTTLPETVDGENTIDPDRAWHHNFNRKLLDKRISPTTGAIDVALGNHRGFRLKAVKMSSIPFEELDKSYKRGEDVSPENVARTLDRLRTIALVVTDNAGNILRFDEKYNVSSTGKIVFFNMRDTSEAITTDFVKSRVQSIGDISKNLGISIADAERLVQEETTKLTNIQNAVFDNKEIILDITGGSLGIIPRDENPSMSYDKALTTVGELMDNIPNTKLIIETEKPNAGRVYAIAGNTKFLVYNRNVTNEEAMSIAEAAFNYLNKAGDRQFSASVAKDFITQYIAFTNKEKNNLEAFLADSTLSASIDSIYNYIVKKPEQSRNRFLSYQGVPSIAYTIENKTIVQTTQQNYLNFWKDKLKVPVTKNRDNSIALRSSYLNFQPTKESIMIVEGKTMKEKKTEQNQSINIKGRKIDPNAFFKNKKQLSNATQKQIDEALEWFKNSELSKILPGEEGFIRLFEIVNSNAKATFSRAGIKLYFGSNFTDLYHESWHAFSQLFLTVEEKQALYDELKKLDGTFLLPNGTRKKYSEASYIQLEEVLAEDFRQYKLSNGSKVLGQRPVANKIFRFILKFLDWLFDGISFQQADTNFNTLNKVHTYYQKLDTNSYKDLKPSYANMMPGIQSLASPIGYDTDSALSVIESEKVSDSIDSVISDIMYRFAKERKVSLISDMFTSKQSLVNAYTLVKESIEDKIDELSKDAENNALALSILNRAIVNFGDINSILEQNNIDGNTTIEYHLRKSKILDFRTKEFNDDDVREDSPDYISQKENQENGKLSFEDLANERVLYLIRTLKSYKKEDNDFVPEKDDLGFDKLNNYRKTLGILISNLNGNTGPNSIFTRLQNIRQPEIAELIEKLGPIDPKETLSDINHFKSWVLFSNSFNTTKLELLLTKFDENTLDDSIKIYNVQASSDVNSARFKSIENFKTNLFNKFAQEVNGELMLNMNKVIDNMGENPSFTFDIALEFFKNLGIPLDKNQEEYKLDKKFSSALPKQASYVFNELKGYAERNNKPIIPNHIDLLTNGDKSDFEFKTQKTVIDSLLKKYIEVSDLISSFSLLNAENEREYENVLNFNISITQNNINESPDYDTLISTPGFEHFDKTRNPMAKVSQTLKRLFDEKGTRVQRMEISKFSGVQENKNGQFVSGQSTIDSDPVTKFYLDFYSYLLSGYITNPTPADKKTYIGYYVKDSSGDAQFVKPKTFLDDLSGDAFFENMMFEYLKAEHERVYDVRNNLVTGIDKLGNFSKFGKHFLIFDNILNKETKAALYEISPSDLLQNPELIATAKNEITEYINALTDENLKVFNTVDFKDDSVLRRVTGLKKITNPNAVNRALIKAHTANSFVHFIESTIMFYGDIAAYELLKQDFHKRNSAASSSGRTFISDPNFISSFNELFGYDYSKSLGYEYGINPDGYINTAIFEDHKYENKKVMAEYIKSWEKAYTSELKALNKFTDEEIKEKVNDIIDKQIKAYELKEVKEGDAQGWVTFDAYRFFAVMSNEWSKVQEDLYQKIVAKEKVDPELLSRVFPPRKYQFYGPLSTSKYHLNVLHKFSLLPLIPTVVQGKNIDKLHKRMMNSNIHYATFKTGSKIAIVTNEKGKADSFYKDSERRIMEDETNPLMINKVHLRFLRNQVPINDYYKNNVVFSTQLRALISNDLFNSGIPISKELGNKVQRYVDSVDAYIEAAKDELKNEINFKSNGSYDAFELAKIIKRELDRRDIPEHLQKVATTMNGKSFAFDLSLAKNASEIESIIFSIANKRIVRRKFNGEPLIQAATTGFENERLTNATTEDIEKYKDDDLQIYRVDPVTGEHLPMDVKISMQGDFKKLLYNDDVKKLAKERGIEPIQALNILIKDEKWLNKSAYPENSIYAKAFAKMESKKGDTKLFVLKSDLTPELLEQLTPDTKDGARVRGKEYFGIKILGDFYSHNTIKSRDGDNIDVIIVDKKEDAEKQFKAYLKGGAKNFKGVVPIKKDTNKMLLRLVGVRIPVQGHNSMEYMQVAEFLPEEAGPIVIVPSYLVAKAGSDFDIDKLSIFFPNVSARTTYDLTEENIKQIVENPSLKAAFEKEIAEGKLKTSEEIVKMYLDSLKNKKKLSGLSENQKLILNEIKKFKDFTDVRYASGNNIDGLENQIMKNMIDLFNTPEIFNMMTKPNGTYLVKELADKMVDYFELEYNPKRSLPNWNRSDIPEMSVSPTNIFELQYNYYKQFYNSVGKTSLGIAANVNKIKSLFNQIGFKHAKSYTHYRKNRKGQVQEQEREIRLLLDHVKEDDGSISLSKLYNVDGIKISDLINQMMNGYLDVAKDPWVAYVMGTPEATPVLLYLIMTGVSFKNAVYFLAQPIVRRYLDDLKKFNSPAKLLDSNFNYENEFQIKRTYMGLDEYASGHTLFSEIMISTRNAINRNPNLFKTEYLFSKLENSKINYQNEIDLRNPDNKAILAHFFEVLDSAKSIAKVQQSFNFDTKTSSSLYDTFRRSKKRDILIDVEDDETANYARMFPKDKLQSLYSDTILSTFDITDIQTSIFSKLFSIRDNENLNDYLYNIYKNEIFWGSNFSRAIEEKLGNNDKFVSEFKNDFTTAMVLKMLNDFNIDDKKYKGFDILEVERDAFRRKDIEIDEAEPTTQPTIVTNPLVEAGVKPTDMAGNASKDIQMANESTQFIGYKSGNSKRVSSTNKYREAWGDKANTGKYTADDVVMVSGSGLWGGVTETQIRETLREKYKPLLEKAIEAGASFRIGNQYAKGNLSDKLVADYLQKRGYREERLDGYSRWTPEVKIKVPESKPVKKGNENPRHVFTGVFIDDGKIYLDYRSLKRIYEDLTDSDQTFVEVGNILVYMPTKKAFKSFNEFVNYSIEKEYLRNNMSNEDIIPITNMYKKLYAGTGKKPEVLSTRRVMKISKDINLKNFLATDGLFVQKLNGLQRLVDARTGDEIYDNVKKKGDTIEFYTVDEAKSIESAKLKAIEMFLTDKAMKNIYNEYSFTRDRLFSYPRQLMAVINTYPSLLNDYILPGLFEPVVRKNSSVMGLKLKTSEKDAIFKSQLHEELSKLSDEGVIKHENPEVNKYISNIFSMLSTYSLFTEGYSKSAGLAISDIIDQTKLSEKMTIQNIDKTVKNDLSNDNYNDFLDLFAKQFFKNRLGLSENKVGWSRTSVSETKNYLVTSQKSLEPLPPTRSGYVKQYTENFYTIDLETIIEDVKEKRTTDRNHVSNSLNKYADLFPDASIILDVSQVKNAKGIKSPNIYIVSSPDEILKSNIDGPIILPSTGLPEKYDEVIPLVFGMVNPSKTGKLEFGNQKISDILNSNAIFTSSDIIQKIRAQAELIMEQINNACSI